MAVRGTDRGTPQQSNLNNVQLTLRVIRNNAPTINAGFSDRIIIDDTTNINTPIYTLTVTDNDDVSIVYFILSS